MSKGDLRSAPKAFYFPANSRVQVVGFFSLALASVQACQVFDYSKCRCVLSTPIPFQILLMLVETSLQLPSCCFDSNTKLPDR